MCLSLRTITSSNYYIFNNATYSYTDTDILLKCITTMEISTFVVTVKINILQYDQHHISDKQPNSAFRRAAF